MNFLVDTDVLSESSKPAPDPKIAAWLHAHKDSAYVSSVSLGELAYGVERLPHGRKRSALEAWLETMRQSLKGRILPFNSAVAIEWGRLVAALEKAGQPMPTVDSQIAATARRHGLTLVTRNEEDFRHGGVRLLNPFES